jgi:hypothetical protein
VAVRRAVITGVNITCARLQLELANEMDCELVEVTSHLGSRPSHAEWQGRIYSIRGATSRYPNLAEATGYGRGDGLCGFNCRHNFYPFFEGLSKPLGNPHDTKESEAYYALNQQQRALERNIRKSKRELSAIDGALENARDTELKALLEKDFISKSSTLKRREQKLNEFIKENDLTLRRDRVQVGGFGRSQAQKATWASKKA